MNYTPKDLIEMFYFLFTKQFKRSIIALVCWSVESICWLISLFVSSPVVFKLKIPFRIVFSLSSSLLIASWISFSKDTYIGASYFIKLVYSRFYHSFFQISILNNAFIYRTFPLNTIWLCLLSSYLTNFLI